MMRLALPAFFLLTFAVTWTLWAMASRFAPPDYSGFFGVQGPVFLLGVFAPSLVAIALTAFLEGRSGVKQLLARIGKWNVAVKWYLFAIGYTAVTKLLAAVVVRIITHDWPDFGHTPVILILGAILISTWAQAGEEIGWRGFALPRLTKHIGLGGASIILGIIWAVWHLPLFYLYGIGSYGQSFLVYLIYVTSVSVALAWLYWKTEGSLLLVMLMHASVNNTEIIPAGSAQVAPLSLSASPVAWATVGVSSAVAIVLFYGMSRVHRV